MDVEFTGELHEQDEDDGDLEYWMPKANADVIVALLETRS